MTMAERVNHPAHYNAGGIECIDALEAATIGLEGIEAFCTANAIKYLWRWKRKNGEEDLQKAIWYINRIIDRAGEPPEERKGLFNMTENKHGFMPKQEITIGGIAFTIIQTAESWVKCIASECIGNGAFDTKNRNDFAASDIREFLNGEFLQKLIGAGAPEAMFEYFNVDLTADDGLKDYGGDCVRVGLMRMAGAMLNECAEVCFLPDWTESRGAKYEFGEAVAQKKPFFFFNDWEAKQNAEK